jgi:signal transduction histidine kinase/CheY-like chemotaxis protein
MMDTRYETELGSGQAGIVRMLRDLREQNLLWALVVPFGAGFALLFSVGAFADPLRSVIPGAMLYLLTAVTWLVRRRSRVVAAWILVIGCATADLLVVMWAGAGTALTLLIIPVGLAALLIDIQSGILAATVCTACLLVGRRVGFGVEKGLLLTTLLCLWSTVGLIWLTLRPLLTALEWSWFSYERSRTLLEKARDSQVQLKQTLQDLVDANVQLMRLDRLAQTLKRAAEDAREAKQQFAANVSHELRTPLNMIVGFTEMIMKAPKSYGVVPAALLADLDVILRNSRHLSSLIDDVLELSQLDARQTTLLKERVALSEIVATAVAAVRPLFSSKGLTLETTVPEGLTLFCDRTRLREVLLNLLSNAGRFTERGGVTICVKVDESDVLVSVADTGPGIAIEDQAKLFQPFQQLDSSIRRRYGGTGLGLTISKSFVELHGGKMWVESEKGQGATFCFRLPKESEASVVAEMGRWLTPGWEHVQRTHRSLVPGATIRRRLVVVGNGHSLERLLARHLEDVEIVPTRTLAEGLEEVARVPAQALLINDPAVSQSLQSLGSSGRLPQGVPALVCTVPGAAEAADALGASEYLVKPITQEALLEALDRLELRGKRVLIVDDEPDAQRLFRRMLTSAGRGYRVLRATEGRHALNILREERPDVILMDLVMPEMDGFELLAAKSADPALRDIPAVILSARDPAGQPVVSKTLAVTRQGGLTVAQLLRCIEALSVILATEGLPGGRALPEAEPG